MSERGTFGSKVTELKYVFRINPIRLSDGVELKKL
jgi:hypothetical protein